MPAWWQVAARSAMLFDCCAVPLALTRSEANLHRRLRMENLVADTPRDAAVSETSKTMDFCGHVTTALLELFSPQD